MNKVSSNILFLILVIIIIGCQKHEEGENLLPNCQITAPAIGEVVGRGDTAIIRITAFDEDGIIEKVQLFINDNEVYTGTNYPFNYSWVTANERPGNFTLKAICTDNRKESMSDEISLSLINVDGSPGTVTDMRDGQVYGIVQIGSQIWFAENLNYKATSSWYYNDDSLTAWRYGRLYNWSSAISACPSGWHLPSDEEWKMMEIEIGMSVQQAEGFGYRGANEGQKLKSTYGWEGAWPGTDEFGFEGLPGGMRGNSGTYSGRSSLGIFWTSTAYDEYNEPSILNRIFGPLHKINRGYYEDVVGLSVRCLKD